MTGLPVKPVVPGRVVPRILSIDGSLSNALPLPLRFWSNGSGNANGNFRNVMLMVLNGWSKIFYGNVMVLNAFF